MFNKHTIMYTHVQFLQNSNLIKKLQRCNSRSSIYNCVAAYNRQVCCCSLTSFKSLVPNVLQCDFVFLRHLNFSPIELFS